MEIKEYVETLLREKIYQNPNKDKHECVQEMKYRKVPIYKTSTLIGFLVGHREIERYSESFYLESINFADFIYGISINDHVDIEIRIGGQCIFNMILKKNEIFYLPYPIFIFRLLYHEIELYIYKHSISQDNIKIILYGIRGDAKIIQKIKVLKICNLMCANGMIGLMINSNCPRLIEYVYRDFNLGKTFPEKLFLDYEINIDIYNSGILSFHKRELCDQIYKEELIEKAWHPSRFMEWCI